MFANLLLRALKSIALEVLTLLRYIIEVPAEPRERAKIASRVSVAGI